MMPDNNQSIDADGLPVVEGAEYKTEDRPCRVTAVMAAGCEDEYEYQQVDWELYRRVKTNAEIFAEEDAKKSIQQEEDG